MDFIRSHKLIVATIIIQIIALPLILLVVKQRQQTTTKASAASTLYFSPQTSSSSPTTKNVNEDMTFDLMVDPGTNLVSLAKLEITYDTTKFSISSDQVVINTQAFPVVVEGATKPDGTLGPILSPGKIQIILSVGNDQTKVIQAPTKILTLTFKAIAPTTSTQIGFGPNNSLLSIAAGDAANENVLSTTNPAFVKINTAPTNTPTPTNSPTSTPTPTNTPTPTPSPSPTPRPTNTPTPTPSPSPTNTPTPTLAPSNTPTPTLANTKLTFTGLKLHGIGKGGDNPNLNSLGTMNPLRPTRSLTVELYNGTNVLINTSTGSITYTGSSNGLFNGIVTLPNSITPGAYIVKIKTPSYMKRAIPGFLDLKANLIGTSIELTSNQQSPVFLVAGDIDNDNLLEKDDDYNLIMECYSDLLPAKSTCDANKKLAADISDDGKVDQDDYNLFLRELSVQQGD